MGRDGILHWVFAALTLASGPATATAVAPPSAPGLAVAPTGVGAFAGEDGHVAQVPDADLTQMRAAQNRALTASVVSTLGPIALGLGLAVTGESDGGDAAGLLLMGGGLVFGPYAGYVAGDCPGRGGAGILIRIGTVVAGALLAGAVASNSGGGFLEIDPAPFIAGGCAAGLVLIDAVVDIARVRGVVRGEWEAKRRGLALRVAPLIGPSEGTVGVGVQLSLTD